MSLPNESKLTETLFGELLSYRYFPELPALIALGQVLLMKKKAPL